MRYLHNGAEESPCKPTSKRSIEPPKPNCARGLIATGDTVGERSSVHEVVRGRGGRWRGNVGIGQHRHEVETVLICRLEELHADHCCESSSLSCSCASGCCPIASLYGALGNVRWMVEIPIRRRSNRSAGDPPHHPDARRTRRQSCSARDRSLQSQHAGTWDASRSYRPAP